MYHLRSLDFDCQKRTWFLPRCILFLIPLPCLTIALTQVHAEMEVSVSRLVPACLTVSVISGGGVRWALKQFFCRLELKIHETIKRLQKDREQLHLKFCNSYFKRWHEWTIVKKKEPMLKMSLILPALWKWHRWMFVGKSLQKWRNLRESSKHATGEAFIGQEKILGYNVEWLGPQEGLLYPFIPKRKFFCFKIFLNCRKML